MLTKNQVERLKKTLEANWGVWNVDELLNNQKELLETLEAAVEVIKFYSKESYNYDDYDISDDAREFLVEWEKEKP